jgi:hypothetical protein
LGVAISQLALEASRVSFWPEGEVNGCQLVRQLSRVKPTHYAHSEFFAF